MRLLLWSALVSVITLCVAFDPKVTVTDFDQPLQGLIYFQDSSVVLYHSSDGSLKRSEDDGASWKDVKLEGAKRNGGIQHLIEHPFDNSIAYALSANSDTHFITTDQGSTWRSFKIQSINRFNPGRPLSFHKSNSRYVIVSGAECPNGNPYSAQCVDRVVYSTSNFENSDHGSRLGDKAFRCEWGHTNKDSDDSIPQDAILCLLEVDNSRRLALSTDFFRSYETIKIDGKDVDNVLDFGTMSKFFVAAVGPETDISLLTSVDLTKWSEGSFPDDGKSTINHVSAFTILESSKHSLHINVAHDGSSKLGEGTLYTSNSKGNYFKKSLDHTSRSNDGLVDTESVEGIDGIVISNVKENEHNVRTKISYDDGRTWSYLSVGDCKDLGGSNPNRCNVNLHAVLDHKNIGRIFSSPAPGILAGIGNTGRKLEDRSKGDFYLSQDSGLTWKRVYRGPHFYEFADQGNIVLAIKDTEEGKKDGTDEVVYSLDRGNTWEKFKLKEKFIPHFLLTTPDATSSKFLLLATRSKNKKPVSIAIDFDGLYKDKCVMKDDGSGDFEKWYARYDPDTKEPTCILGHKQFFWRKKIDSRCYVGDLYHEQFASTEDCPCAEVDYECDERFVLSPEGQCVPNRDYLKELKQCKTGETYERSTGYALIPGNTCKKDGGKTLDGKKSVVCGSEENGDNGDDNGDKADGKIKSHRNLFNGEIVNYFYLPLDKDSVDDETIIAQNSYDEAFITHDQGLNWDKLLDGKEIASITSNPNFPNDVYVLTFDSQLHISTDRGHSFNNVKLPANVAPQYGGSIDFHPKNREWLIYMGETGCDNPFSCKLGAYYSTNGGKSWDKLVEDVTRCSWVGQLLHKTDEKLIFCNHIVSEGFTARKALVSSEDYFKTKTTHFDSVVGYAFQSEFIVVATVSIDGI
ncbi:Vth2p [Sugiyamaella lignohabitans]|uniref:Vth2p n=1 Tax=Sugiyamaella lignohabitans TaxID=796027 RepID=A0A167DIT0_9ASCO|nr:Vth2p [Sugiyamaella lignohabitans]ANB12963.1 Vth2p [Sugiyamaella lignohabitans]